MFKILLSGGIVMIPIILCGILATYIIVERFIFFKNTKKQDEDLMNNLDLALIKHDYFTAEAVCAGCQSPLGAVVSKSVLNRQLREEDIKELTQTELDYSVGLIEYRMNWLGVIANVTTLLGLLGTVCGNIRAFGILGKGGFVEAPSVLADSIGLALVSTAAGLLVAIPVLVCSCILKSIAEKRISEMEKFVTNLIMRLTGRVL